MLLTKNNAALRLLFEGGLLDHSRAEARGMLPQVGEKHQGIAWEGWFYCHVEEVLFLLV